MRFATERLIVATVSKPVPAKAGAELTFGPYILLMEDVFFSSEKPQNSNRISITGKYTLGFWSPWWFLDNSVPFLPFFLIFYSLYYPVMAAPLFLKIKSEDMKYLLLSLLTASLINYFLSFTVSLSPSARPSLAGGEGFLIFFVKLLYKYDVAGMYFPSLHSLHPLLISLHLWKVDPYGRILLPCALLISLSTVFIKQHFVSDTLAALLLAPSIYYGSYWSILGFKRVRGLFQIRFS